MTGRMQYLVSLTDKTMEKIIEMEKSYNLNRDEVIEAVVNFTYQNKPTLLEKVHTKEEEESLIIGTLVTMLKKSVGENKKITIEIEP